MKLSTLLFSVVALATACASAPKRTETLMDEVRGYNDGIRWQKFPAAAVRVPPKERDDFLDEREELEDDLRVADYEVTRVRYGNRHQSATIQVKWQWLLDSRGILHTTTTEQQWRLYGKDWLMVEERRLRGEPMPGVAEPLPDKDEDPAADTESAANAPEDVASVR